jgi:hypothetical protein
MPVVVTPEILAIAFFVQSLIIAFFCRTLYKALLMVRESNRTISAGTVWLLLIPFFEKLWNFKVVSSVASSLHKEFTDRNFEIEEQPGLNYGMIYAVLSVGSSILIIILPALFIVGGALNIIALIFFVKYWMKINWYRKILVDDLQDSENTTS